MRELSREEVCLVAGGVTASLSIGPGSLTIGNPLGAIPVLSIQFEGNHGTLTIGGITTPFGPGFPPIRLS